METTHCQLYIRAVEWMGRGADLMKQTVELLRKCSLAEVICASPRARCNLMDKGSETKFYYWASVYFHALLMRFVPDPSYFDKCLYCACHRMADSTPIPSIKANCHSFLNHSSFISLSYTACTEWNYLLTLANRHYDPNWLKFSETVSRR